jgi:hypothetical protein
MAHWHLHTLPYPSASVLNAAVAAAEDLGFAISQVDQTGGHAYLTYPRSFGRRNWVVDVAVTDSGLGGTILRVGWGSATSLPGPISPVGRQAARLNRQCLAYLRDWFPA